MSDSDKKWKEQQAQCVEASLDFFASRNKLKREMWVVRKLLVDCGIPFHESELEAADEPGDIKFRQANFQVKEIMEKERRRGDEYKAKLDQIYAAESETDLLEPYRPRAISFSDVAGLVLEKAKDLATGKYGPNERLGIDLLCYFNHSDVAVTPPIRNSFDFDGFRSVCVVTNTYCGVLYSGASAPSFLRSGVFERGAPAMPNTI